MAEEVTYEHYGELGLFSLGGTPGGSPYPATGRFRSPQIGADAFASGDGGVMIEATLGACLPAAVTRIGLNSTGVNFDLNISGGGGSWSPSANVSFGQSNDNGSVTGSAIGTADFLRLTWEGRKPESGAASWEWTDNNLTDDPSAGQEGLQWVAFASVEPSYARLVRLGGVDYWMLPVFWIVTIEHFTAIEPEGEGDPFWTPSSPDGRWSMGSPSADIYTTASAYRFLDSSKCKLSSDVSLDGFPVLERPTATETGDPFAFSMSLDLTSILR